jgi:aryl-phospho-beta-D-glucosidase BglC (GH1 family)
LIYTIFVVIWYHNLKIPFITMMRSYLPLFKKLTLLIFVCFLTFSKGFCQYPANSPVAKNGKLKLIGVNLVSECGNNVQLRGMSTHGPQWYGNCITTAGLDVLVNTWGIDVYRLALYVEEGGYVNNPSGWKTWVDTWVTECGNRGIYCLIDWHVLNPGNPNNDIVAARDFWQYIATQHGSKKHVLYEICNEPNGVNWATVKTYADDIIPKIRAIDPNTIIIVGTPTWSQDVDIASTNKLSYTNIMYTLHFYSGSHFQSLRDKANTAMANGAAIFVTECGTSDASGNGGPYLPEADNWMSWMQTNNISWCNWSYSDKSETSAALTSGACNAGNWNSTTTSGTYIKGKISSPADNFTSCGGVSVTLTTTPSSATIFNEGDPITLNATATTATGTITKVDFYDGATLLGTDLTGPYSFPIASLTSGSHNFRAVATNSGGLTGEATSIIDVNKAVFKTNTAPTIDGTPEAMWNSYTSASLANTNGGTVSSAADLSANWKAMWDNTNIYILVTVTDDVKKNDSPVANSYDDDEVEIYIDMGNTNTATYGSNQFRYAFRWNDATVYENQHNAITGVQFAKTDPTSTSYVMEVKIPWSTLGSATPAINSLQGFEVMVNDDDDNGTRDGKIAWSATTDNTWQTPSLMGTVILKGTSPLPVTLLDFNIFDQGNSTLVSWTTSSEVDNDHFELERSDDGINFVLIATIKGTGNSSSIAEYEYNDNKPWLGQVYYRLKQVDINGDYKYSGLRELSGRSGEIKVSPNPANDEISIEFYTTSEATMIIYDMLGKEILKDVFVVGQTRRSYNISSLPDGIYVMIIKNTSFTISKKLLVE